MNATGTETGRAPDDLFLSVIVCTYNRADLLDLSLHSLRGQRLAPQRFEVIVVDNNSTDDTAAVVARHTALAPNIRRVVETRQGLSHARNCGWEQARGQYLVYNDDDAIMPPDYLAQVIDVINRHQPDILGGPVCPFYTSPKPRWWRDEFEFRCYTPASGFSATCRVTGVNFIIRRDLLPRLGMFSPELGMVGATLGLGEEAKVLDTYRAITPAQDQKVYYAHECYLYHHVPDWKMRFGYMVRRSYVNGRTKIRLTRTGRAVTLGFLVRDVAERLYVLARTLASHVRRKRLSSGSFVLAFRTLAFIMGVLVEGLAVRGRRS
jgi:glucosyl-dolichyl phosphate glucuronosyltransferase